MFLTRGFIFSYEAVRDWEAKLTPALAENLRRRHKGRIGPSWYIDETYIRVRGRWRYLYRAIDRDGALVDVMLSEHRDLAAARAFFRLAKAVTGVTPDRVTTDGHDAYPRANMCGIERADISTTDLSRTIAASRIDVDRCLD
jgi:putative transposase